MPARISFLDKIYYKEQKKIFASSRGDKCQRLWEQVLLANQKHKNNLLVFPSAGLGNRLRVIAAAWNIGEKLKKKVSFYWDVNCDVGSNWDSIFFAPNLYWQKNPFQFSQQIYVSRKNLHVKNHLCAIGFQENNIFYTKKYTTANLNIYSCWSGDFPRKGVFFAQNFFLLLKPASAVQKLLGQFLSTDKKKLGIHIRFTDAPLKRNADWILTMVKYLVMKYLTYTIVLVSDNQKIKDQILAILPHHRVCYQKTSLTSDLSFSQDRTNLLGMQVAAADLFALASCSVLWTNKPHSSFYTAARAIQYNKN